MKALVSNESGTKKKYWREGSEANSIVYDEGDIKVIKGVHDKLTEDMIAIDVMCAENISYDNNDNDLTTYESQENILADISRASNDRTGVAIVNTNSNKDGASDD